MLRFIFKQRVAESHSDFRNEQIFSIVTNIPLVEALLTRGGHGPDGFDVTTLVGVEVFEDAPQEGSGAPVNIAQQGQ